MTLAAETLAAGQRLPLLFAEPSELASILAQNDPKPLTIFTNTV
jgi:hypothetical protein